MTGALSFATYLLTKNPATMIKLQAEVDEVVENRQITLDDISKLHYTMGMMPPFFVLLRLIYHV